MAAIRAWRAQPSEQRENYRRQLLLMTPEQRAAALAH